MEATSRMVVAYLLNSTWQVTVILGFAILCSQCLRRMPGRHKHVLWVLCLGAGIVIPAATVLVASPAGGSGTANSPHVAAQQVRAAGSVGPGFGWELLRFPGRARAVRLTPNFQKALSGIYAGLLLFQLMRLAWIYRRTMQTGKNACRRALPPVLLRAWKRCSRQFSIPGIRVLCAEDLSGPATLGWRRPVLMVPERFFSQEVCELDLVSALAHELAHIRRHDFLLNLLYEVASLPLCFHPAMAVIKARIAQTRELACDEMAARLLPSGTDYARSLLHLAQTMLAAAPSAKSNYAMGLFDTQALEERIMNILNVSKNARRGSRARVLAALCLLGAGSLWISTFSLRVAGDSAPGDSERFVGTWVTKYKGQTFITIKLKSENGRLGGTCVHVDRVANVDGELIPTSDQFTEQEIVEAKVSGNRAELRIGGHDSIYLEFTWKGANDADVIVVARAPANAGNGGAAPDVGNPEQAPLPKKPWHFQRVAAN